VTNGIKDFPKEPEFEEVMGFINEHGNQISKGASLAGTEVFAAYFDILGFREAMKSDAGKLYETYKEATHETREAIRPTGARSRKGPDGKWQVEIVGYHKLNPPVTFSDATFIVSTDASLRSFREICHVSNRFFLQMLAREFPIRGAISKGTAFWDIERGLFLGEALTSAYEFGEQMDVVGMCVHPMAQIAVEAEITDEVSLPVEVAFHGGRRVRLGVPLQGKAITFSQNFGDPGNIWRRLYARSHASGNVSLIAKYQNSESIVKAMLPEGTYLPIEKVTK
jgi:hypothetical protein